MRQVDVGAVFLLSLTFLTACTPGPRQVPPTSSLPAPASVAGFPTSTHSQPPPAQISPMASWIEVDLRRQTVTLHERGQVIAEYPAATGVLTDPKYATPPGLYHVQSKEHGPIESVPGVFVSDVIMFDWGNGNGIHSRPMDANGNLLDARLGQPVTAGCVRVGEPAKVFEFAQLGMWVWIH